jgi:hypothetical protein
MSLAASPVTVRPVEEHEVSRVIDFLRSGFVRNRAPEALRPLFEYRWAGIVDKPNRGFALWSGNEIVGFLGAVYAERPLAGRIVKTCNLSTWYVLPELRRAAMKLLYAAIAQKQYAITNLTPSPGVGVVMEAIGFQVIDKCKLVYLPWHFGWKIARPGPEVLTDFRQIGSVLEGEEAELWRDHLPCPVKHYVLRDGGEYSYLVLKRRLVPGEVAFSRIPVRKVRLMWYPCMEVLHLGNAGLAVRNWGRLVCTILRRERVLAVVAAERFLGRSAPAGARLDHRNYLLARSPLNATIDSLYSELAVLPT